MLYISTRNPKDAYTAHRALHEEFAPDGGMFVPFQDVTLSDEELEALSTDSFGLTVAKILNRFFSARLSGWDVDCCIGRNPVKFATLGRRTLVGELWHNLEGSYSALEQSLFTAMTGSRNAPAGWASIAIRIAVVCGLVGELIRAGIEKADFAVACGDFSTPMAIWYARKMGLPVGMILCICNENGTLWDLLQRGECNTGAAVVKTNLPELDFAFPGQLERLIFATQNKEEFTRFLEVTAKGGVYAPDEEKMSLINEGLCASVVGSPRVDSVVSSVFRTNDYIIDPVTALAFGGLQDYRARTGENRTTVLLAGRNPQFYADRISRAIGLTEQELSNRLKL